VSHPGLRTAATKELRLPTQFNTEGLKAFAMNDQQRAMPLDFISKWAGLVYR
jgi:hypothetical protein